MGQRATGILWVEARDAARNPTLHRTDTPNEELSKISIVHGLRALK